MARVPERFSDLVAGLFQPAISPQRPDGAMGAELEVIPIRVGSRRRVPINADHHGPGSADVARDAARRNGWREETDEYGAPTWKIPGGGKVCYEPGGQLEIVSPVLASAADLSLHLRNVLGTLGASAQAADVQLLAIGIDPYNALSSTPLELHGPRYDSMARYFDGIGEAGARMMRQTASLQVSVELGMHVMQRWELLNSLAPFLTAVFANSSHYCGQPTGYASYRARQWQTLDPTRTGLPFSATDPIGAYTQFARDAGRILNDDIAHITTLFPEIRPRGYFEIRSLDSMEPERIDLALLWISTLVHEVDVAASALRIAGPPDSSLLVRAALNGKSDSLLKPRIERLEKLIEDASGLDPR